jgi:hypothetical protein
MDLSKYVEIDDKRYSIVIREEFDEDGAQIPQLPPVNTSEKAILQDSPLTNSLPVSNTTFQNTRVTHHSPLQVTYHTSLQDTQVIHHSPLKDVQIIHHSPLQNVQTTYYSPLQNAPSALQDAQVIHRPDITPLKMRSNICEICEKCEKCGMAFGKKIKTSESEFTYRKKGSAACGEKISKCAKCYKKQDMAPPPPRIDIFDVEKFYRDLSLLHPSTIVQTVQQQQLPPSPVAASLMSPLMPLMPPSPVAASVMSPMAASPLQANITTASSDISLWDLNNDFIPDIVF